MGGALVGDTAFWFVSLVPLRRGSTLHSNHPNRRTCWQTAGAHCLVNWATAADVTTRRGVWLVEKNGQSDSPT